MIDRLIEMFTTIPEGDLFVIVLLAGGLAIIFTGGTGVDTE